MPTKTLEVMKTSNGLEPSPRGLVPTGASDFVYDEFLHRMKLRDKTDPIGQTARLALAASGEPRFMMFLELITSNRNMSLAACAKQCQISLIEFQAFWRSAQVNHALGKAIDALPGLTIDLIEDSKSEEYTCPMCDGTGEITREGKPTKICPNCNGKGVVRVTGNKDARKQLLEMTGVIKQPAPVQVNLDMRGQGMNAAAAKLQKAVPFDLDVPEVRDSENIIDAEPIDTPGESA